MPKIKDAFALRDFDAQRIFQRIVFVEEKKKTRYNVFDWLELGIKILTIDMLHKKAYELTDKDFFDFVCEQVKRQQVACEYSGISLITGVLKGVSEEVVAYLEKVCRHSKRLEEYSRKWNDRICADETLSVTEIRARTRRIQFLLQSYLDVQRATKNLQYSIKKSIVEIIGDNTQNDRDIFARRLRQARTKKGMTQEEIAKKLGIKQSTYAAYETARNVPNVSLLASLSTELQRPTDWLLGLTP